MPPLEMSDNQTARSGSETTQTVTLPQLQTAIAQVFAAVDLVLELGAKLLCDILVPFAGADTDLMLQGGCFKLIVEGRECELAEVADPAAVAVVESILSVLAPVINPDGIVLGIQDGRWRAAGEE